MPPPSTTTIITQHDERNETPTQYSVWMNTLLQRDRLWLLLIILMVAALFLGGCHARSGGCQTQTSCGSCEADGFLAVFYVVYLLGWIIVSTAGG